MDREEFKSIISKKEISRKDFLKNRDDFVNKIISINSVNDIYFYYNEQQKISNRNIVNIIKNNWDNFSYHGLEVRNIIKFLSVEDCVFDLFNFLSEKSDDNGKIHLATSLLDMKSTKISKEKLIKFIDDNLLNNIDEFNQAKIIKNILSYYMSNHKNEIKMSYDSINPILSKINKIGIENIFENFESLFFLAESIFDSRLDSNYKSITKYNYLKDNVNLSDLPFSAYIHNIDKHLIGGQPFTWDLYEYNIDVYNKLFDDFFDYRKSDEFKVRNIMNSRKPFQKKFENIHETFLKIVNYNLETHTFSFTGLISIADRDTNLPKLKVKTNPYDDTTFKEFVNKHGCEKVSLLMLNLEFKEKDVFLNKLKENFKDELLELEKKLIEENNKQLLDKLNEINLFFQVENNENRVKRKRKMY